MGGIIELVWGDIERCGAQGRTVTLKMRLSDFSLRTRGRSLPVAVRDKDEFGAVARGLLEEVLPLPQSVRLLDRKSVV